MRIRRMFGTTAMPSSPHMLASGDDPVRPAQDDQSRYHQGDDARHRRVGVDQSNALDSRDQHRDQRGAENIAQSTDDHYHEDDHYDVQAHFGTNRNDRTG